MSMMDVCGPVFCPECPPWKDRRGVRRGEHLTCSDSNYSGTGADMANCPKCGKGFCISYKIDKIDRAEDWDIDLEKERQEEIASAEEYARSLRQRAEKAEQDAKELAAKPKRK